MNKLTDNAVCNIRHAVNVQSMTRSEVARKYSVSPSTVSAIASGKTYRSVPQARSIPGFDNYIVYPNGKVWSLNRETFIKPVRKSNNSKARYINLRNRDSRRSFQVPRLVSSLF